MSVRTRHELLMTAEELLRLGLPKKAVEICQHLLHEPTQQFGALLVMGESYYQLGDYEAALQAFSRAHRLQPDNDAIIFWLGKLNLIQNQYAKAEDYFSQLIRDYPEVESGWVYLGITYLEAGDVTRAIRILEEGLRHHPGSMLLKSYLGGAYAQDKQFQRAYDLLLPVVESGNNVLGEWTLVRLADTCKALQKPEEAIRWYQEAVQLNAANAQARNNLGTLLVETHQPDKALQHFQQLVKEFPQVPVYHFNCGNAYRALGRLKEAAECYQQAISLNSRFFEAHYNLAKVLSDLGELSQSEHHFEQAVRLNPRLKESWVNYVYVLQEQGKVAEALQIVEQGLHQFPNDKTLRWNRCVLFLLQGQYRQAWPDYELRLEMGQTKVPNYPFPRWDGQPIGDKTLLVYNDQGLGDAIQFFRFLPRIRPHVGRLVLQVPEPLHRLLAYQQIADEIVTEIPEYRDAIDYQIPIGSLPGVLNVSLQEVSVEVPYLKIDAAWQLSLKSFFLKLNKFNIGIVWRGNPKHTRDMDRSLRLSYFQPLAEIPGVQLFSLQKGGGENEVRQVPFGNKIIPLGHLLTDMALTAAVIQQLDLVITVDTSVAHLSAALGKPTWILLQFAPDWRWLLHRTDSPWYPTVQLFRQTRWRDWNTVFEAVIQALREECKKCESEL